MFLYAVSRRVCKTPLVRATPSRTFSSTAYHSFIDDLTADFDARVARASGEDNEDYFRHQAEKRVLKEHARRERRSKHNQEEHHPGSEYDALYDFADDDSNVFDFETIAQKEDPFVPPLFEYTKDGEVDPFAQKEAEPASEAAPEFNFYDLEKFMSGDVEGLEGEYELPADDDPEIQRQVEEILAEEREIDDTIAHLMPGSAENRTEKIHGILFDKYVLGTASEKMAAELVRGKIQTWNDAFPHVESMIVSIRRRTPIMKRKLVLEQRRIAKRREKYAAVNQERAKKSKQRRREFIAMAQNDKDWFHYPEINVWVHRHFLEYAHVRSAIRTILNNVTYTNKQKKQAIDTLITYIRNAEEKPKEWYTRRRKLFFEGIARFDNVSSVQSPDLNKDPNFEMPQTYEELIARAEAEMAPEDRAARYAPPTHKFTPRAIDY